MSGPGEHMPRPPFLMGGLIKQVEQEKATDVFVHFDLSKV